MVEMETEAFVIRPGTFRVIFVSIGLVLCAALFLVMAAGAVLLAIRIDSSAIGLFLAAAALLLALLTSWLLLLLTTLALRIEVGPRRVTLRMPRMRGHLVLPSLIRADLPYEAIHSIERRTEIYRSFGIENWQYAFSLVTRDGTRLPLGVMAGVGYAYPFDKAAEEIAERAGCARVDRGAVRAGGILRSMIRDVPPWEPRLRSLD